MSELDLYYRAFRAYRALTVNNEKTHRLTVAVQKANSKDDRLEAIRTRCIIEEEWVKTIEEYLPYVDNAVREDRQFIRKEGEVVPIEKVKKISKDSVAHLSRHSDFISHLPEDPADTLIPDKIFMTENESNYAVYENRFLYMLLCYLRDFVEVRYTKIAELGNTYNGNLVMHRHFHVNKREIFYDVTFRETAKNDPRSTFDKESSSMIERLESIRMWVSALLLTPLMNEVSKAPMLKPPITRTNVLKMDNNFKNAVALYDYLAAYTKEGYTIEEIKKTISPFHEGLEESVSEMVPLTSYFVYQYGNGLEDELKEAFKKAEEERKREEAERERRKIEEMKKRIEEMGESPERYMLALEERNRKLEIDSRNIEEQNQKLRDANAHYAKTQEILTATVAALEQKELALSAELRELNERYEQETARLIREAEEERARLIAEAEADRARLVEEAAAERQRLIESAAEEKRATEEQNAQRMREVTESYESRLAEEREGRRTERKTLSDERDVLHARCLEYEETLLGLQARFHAVQYKAGERPVEDTTSKAYFKQLEKEKAWFEKMFEGNWKETKKRIRKDLLWTKPQKEAPMQMTVEERLSEAPAEPAELEKTAEEWSETVSEAVTEQMDETVLPETAEETEEVMPPEDGEMDGEEVDAESKPFDEG